MALAFRVLLQYLDLNDIYSLKNFLDSNSFQVDDRDENGATILMHAATRGVTSFVKVNFKIVFNFILNSFTCLFTKYFYTGAGIERR